MAEAGAPSDSIRVASWAELTQTIAAALDRRGVHSAEAVVLLPYPSLAPLARQAWCSGAASGFAPRFETALQCASRIGGALPGTGDITFDTASDRLSATHLLATIGLDPLPALSARLLERAHALAQPAAAAGPQGRAQWAAGARRALARDGAGSPAALDAVLGRVAIEWCVASQYATDILFESVPAKPWDLLFVMDGIAPEPLSKALLAHWSECSLRLHWTVADPSQPVPVARALDAGEEAEMAAALILRHVEQGRTPVGLVANDRFLTRRISAQLNQRGVSLCDETGWTLSTTRMAAHTMLALRACAWDAGSEDVLEWLKSAPCFGAREVTELERMLRDSGEPHWSRFAARWAEAGPAAGPDVCPLIRKAQELRGRMREERALTDWLAALRALLEGMGLWERMAQDAAGAQAIRALRLTPRASAEMARHEAARRRWTLSEFVSWVDAVLESQRFMPPHEPGAQVVVLPMGQLMGRQFAALVMPGCDEHQLSASPEPQGPWSAAQRVLLGLSGQGEIEAAQRLAWAHAVAAPGCQLLHHEKEMGDEPIAASPLLLELRLRGMTQTLADPREWQESAFTPVHQARPQGARLAVAAISASAYEDLRRCPYRFFALHQLGLRERDEIEEEIGKRDFGIWLHEVLRRFHEAMASSGAAEPRERLLERCAQDARQALHLDEAQFLPFLAVWPNMKAGYLDWLAKRETGGALFESAELRLERDLVQFKLIGRIDRIDRLQGGAPSLIDYKTEGAQKTAARVADPLEDTQLAFYAALIDEERPVACYLNIGERGEVVERGQPHIAMACEAMLDGLWSDLGRIRDGAPLPALGEGESCEHCAARGLCRKDFWSAS